MSTPTTAARTTPSPRRGRPGYGPVRAVVESVTHLSPSFARLVFSGADMISVGSEEPVFDQRIKLIFPTPGHPLPELPDDETWYTSWLELPASTRGCMRTYSIRDLESTPNSTHLTVDFVLHLEPGLCGPAATWASQAVPGDEILILAPRRDAGAAGGIEFDPAGAPAVILAGDETAAPAIARILEDLSRTQPDILGTAFIEVPGPQAVLPIAGPAGVEMRWLPRNGRDHGARLAPAVLEHLGMVLIDAHPNTPSTPADPDAPDARDAPSPELVWETPAFSATGEEVATHDVNSDIYYWIAGESGVITRLRRHLVKDRGVARSQVAFMGYWKHGIAMKS